MMTSPTNFKGFTAGGSTEVRSAIVDNQVMSDHEKMSSGKCTLGMKGGSHRTGTVKALLRDTSTLNTLPIGEMENLVTAASVNISKATLQRIEPAIKSSQKALPMEADPCNQPIDGSNMQVEDSVDITEGVVIARC